MGLFPTTAGADGAGREVANMSAIVPLRPVRILGQTTLVDIAPTSQYDSKSDSAVIRTQLLVENDQAEMSLPLAFLTMDSDESNPPVVRVKGEKREMHRQTLDSAEVTAFLDAAVAAAVAAGSPADTVRTSLQQVVEHAAQHHKTYVTLKQGQKLLLEFVSRERVKVDPASRTATFTTLAPLPQYQLAAGGTLWLAVALPRPLAGLGVNLVAATEGFNKVDTDIHGRKIVAWQWQNDPFLSVTYQYA